jgi:AmmeMemoRadiSam system protein B
VDLDLIPVQHGEDQLVLVRDPLGLVPQGRALPVQLFEFLALLDGTRSIIDLQMELIRQRGGVLVGSHEVEQLLQHLDESYLLQTDRYVQARERMVKAFGEQTVRPCSHGGEAYPADAAQLRSQLDEILGHADAFDPRPEGSVVALVAPHIDLSVGSCLYGKAYRWLREATPSRVVVLGVGHQIADACFSLTAKDFRTPLGDVQNDRHAVRRLRAAGGGIVAADDFAHKDEHSVEFQVIFLQHVLPPGSFTLIPILCGSLRPVLMSYDRRSYRGTAGPFLEELSNLITESRGEALVVAGVDFSHIGPKFGHPMPATSMESRSGQHDRALLKSMTAGDVDGFWAESARVEDQFNVCGFSALACLLEVLPPAQCRLLGYQTWHEAPTRSAVSFAAAVFTTD